MDYSLADMVCVLKVNTECEACKSKVMRILQRVRGAYNITIDGEEGAVKVSGRVNPSTLLRMLQKYGKHAEVKYVKFDGEVLERSSLDYYGEYGYSLYDGMGHYGFPYFQPPLPPPPPPPYPQPYPPPYPFAPPLFPPHPPHYNNQFGPHPLPPRPRPRPPPPPPVEKPTESKPKPCAIM